MDPWNPPSAYIVRHGETVLNSENCYRGWDNPCLNDNGLEQAEIASNFLAYERIGRIVSSDLDRAQSTANIIFNACNVECPYVSLDFSLRPWGIGAFAGEEKTAKNQAKLNYFIENPEEKIPDAESLNDFQARQDALLHYILTPMAGLPTVIVTHTSNLTYLQEKIDLDNGMSSSRAPEVHDIVAPGGIVAVYVDTDGKMRMEPRLGMVEAPAEAAS